VDVRRKDLPALLGDHPVLNALPDELGANRDRGIRGRLKVRDRALQELRMPGVIVIVDGDVSRSALLYRLVESGVRTTWGVVADEEHPAGERGLLRADHLIDRGRIPAVVQHDELPVREGLGADVGQGSGQEQRPVLGAHDHGHRRCLLCHQRPLSPGADRWIRTIAEDAQV
jgi:hypothetical protein